MSDRRQPPESVPPLTGMPPTARETSGPELHTYMVQRHTMRVGKPLTFSDGESIVAVLSSSPVPLRAMDIEVTVLVELPPP